jgi:nucleoid-associated protein YgaU
MALQYILTVKIKPIRPYNKGTSVTLSPTESLLIPNFSMEEGTNVKRHFVSPDDTIFSIAHKYYQDSTQYIRICEFNKILDPFNLEVNTYLSIPL